ncbi:DUF5723 family protein [Capnocytophaga stomatis]|uniref:DUF5723 family protein n=1 Tax=Capnocytophaga stomatis TaxID=1848904 RepID=UPI001BB326D0|nr:DUF5723 family protein [Capnocytophaga stomatis]
MKKILLLAFSFSALGSIAQELRSSYFMETSAFRHQMNPALLDKPYVAVPLMGNINIGTRGKNGHSTFLYPLEGNQDNRLVTFLHPSVDGKDFLKKIKNNVTINANLNYNLLSVAFNAFNGTNLVEVNVRSNNYGIFPHHLFVFMKSPASKKNYSFKKLGMKSETYAELVLGHSRKLSRRLSVGAKLKVLIGASYGEFKMNHFNISSAGRYWNIDGDTELTTAVLNSHLRYSDDPGLQPQNPSNSKPRVNDLSDPTFGLPGRGIALDMGVTYKTPFIEELTLSASLTDVGYMVWKNANLASSKGNWVFDGFKDFSHYNPTESPTVSAQMNRLKIETARMLSLYYDGKKNVGKMLPATINLGADYVVPSYDKLHFGVLFSHRFNDIYSFSQMIFSANIRPIDWLEASLSTSATSDSITFGGMVSFYTPRFNFYIGSDRFFGSLSEQYIPKNSLNANINLGFVIPLERRYR